VDDLTEVKGVGEKTLAKLRPLLMVSDPGCGKLERKKPTSGDGDCFQVGKMQRATRPSI